MKVLLKVNYKIVKHVQEAMLKEADGFYSQFFGWGCNGGFYCEPEDKASDLFETQWVICPLDSESRFSTVLKKHKTLNPKSRVFGWNTSAGNFMGISIKRKFMYFDARRHAVRELLRFLPDYVEPCELEVLSIFSRSTASWYKAGVEAAI